MDRLSVHLWSGYWSLHATTYDCSSNRSQDRRRANWNRCHCLIQTLGGALFISVGQNVFSNKLVAGLSESLPNIDPVAILNTGATSLKSTFPADMQPAILKAYNHALIECFYPAVAMSVVGVIASFGVEWASVKGKKVEAVAGA